AASSFSRGSCPASRNSTFRPISRIRRASSILLATEMRATRNRTPARRSESNHAELSCENPSPESDVQFVIHRSLRPIVAKRPLQPRLPVVEFRHFWNHRRHVGAEQLPRLFSQLQHHADRRPLPGRLI